MRKKVAEIQTKENVLNSSAFKQAGRSSSGPATTPYIRLHGNSIGVQALRKALTKIGDPVRLGRGRAERV